MRLKSKLLSLNASKAKPVKVYSPANCEEIRIPFRVDKMAKVVGRLAQIPPPETTDVQDTRLLTGVLVQNGFDLSLMAPEDLREYAGLNTTTVICKQHFTLGSASLELIRWALEGTFGAIEEVGSSMVEAESNSKHEGNGSAIKGEQEEADEEISSNETTVYLVMGCVFLRYFSRTREIVLEWEGTMMNDGIADAVMAVLLTVESTPASVKRKLP